MKHHFPRKKKKMNFLMWAQRVGKGICVYLRELVESGRKGETTRARAIGIFPLLCVSLLPQDMGCQCHTCRLPIN